MQRSSEFHLPSLGQFLLSALGLITLSGAALLIALMGVIQVIQNGTGDFQITYTFSIAWMAGILALLTLPSLVFSLLRMLNKSLPQRKLKTGLPLANALVVIWPALLFAGNYVTQQPDLAWLLLPPINVLTILFPILWFLSIGLRGIHSFGSQRTWGLVTFGLTLTQTIVMIVEIVVLLVLGVLAVLWIATNPAWSQELQRLALRLTTSQADVETLQRILMPYLQKPGVIAASLMVIAGLVPMIEELLKPLALWLLINKRFSPQEGYAMGLICGGTFALIESLGMIAQSPAEGWLALAVGRMGTSLLHILTTALVGWGLGMAWSQRKYLQLGTAFLTAVIIHGIWNTFSITMTFAELAPDSGLPARVGSIAPYALGIMVLTMFLVLLINNRTLRSAGKTSTVNAPDMKE